MSIDEREILQKALDNALRALGILEKQVAGYGSLDVPSHKQIELEDKRKEVAELKKRMADLTETSFSSNTSHAEGSESMTATPQTDKAFKVFISYSHLDSLLRDKMEKSLVALNQQGLISTWYDGQILPGKKWEEEIIENRDSAEIALFLVSPDFMASDYILHKELKPILERAKSGEVYILVVLLRPTFFTGTDLAAFQMLPVDNKRKLKPVTSWSNQDEAFLNVAEGIYSVAMHLRKNPLM